MGTFHIIKKQSEVSCTTAETDWWVGVHGITEIGVLGLRPSGFWNEKTLINFSSLNKVSMRNLVTLGQTVWT